jgi:hypothetical protein
MLTASARTEHPGACRLQVRERIAPHQIRTTESAFFLRRQALPSAAPSAARSLRSLHRIRRPRRAAMIAATVANRISLPALFCAGMTLLLCAAARHAAAQERPAWQANVARTYASAAGEAPKSVRSDSPLKNLQTPVLKTISPDAAPSALALPEHRTVVDQMLQSHEFTFGRNRKASNFAGANRPAAGTNLDLDAVKLRISRDKVIVKAEWTFN